MPRAGRAHTRSQKAELRACFLQKEKLDIGWGDYIIGLQDKSLLWDFCRAKLPRFRVGDKHAGYFHFIGALIPADIPGQGCKNVVPMQ